MLLVFPAEEKGRKDGPVLHNMSALPRHKVEDARKPVFGLKLIDLGKCLKYNGVPIGRDDASLQDAEYFWKELKDRHGITRESIDARASGWRGFLAGRTYHKVQADAKDPGLLDRTPVCTDIELTVAILARLAGSLFLPRREPDYDMEHLLGRKFMVDDPRVPAAETDPQNEKKPDKASK
ncbi:MAG: hypothetical protein OSA95_04490 [Opitutales bacterium]|nr:hypothetical protein [Opitutales bacterium]